MQKKFSHKLLRKTSKFKTNFHRFIMGWVCTRASRWSMNLATSYPPRNLSHLLLTNVQKRLIKQTKIIIILTAILPKQALKFQRIRKLKFQIGEDHPCQNSIMPLIRKITKDQRRHPQNNHPQTNLHHFHHLLVSIVLKGH